MDLDARDSYIVTFPMELLVAIASWLPVRERMRLQCVSRRLRSAGEAPSLWRDFVWDYFGLREEFCVSKTLKVYGCHIRRLGFPGYLSPNLELLKYCSNVRHLSLPVTMILNPDELAQLVEAIHHMKQLHMLDTCWESDVNIKPLLQMVSSLKEITLYLSKHCAAEPVVDSVIEWIDMGFNPPKLNLVFTGSNYLAQINHMSEENWQEWNTKIPVGEAACLKVYNNLKTPLNILPVLPIFQLEFGQTAAAPLVRPKQCGISGLSSKNLRLTDNCGAYKATDSAFSWHACYNDIGNLDFLTHFDIDDTCSTFFPTDLEQLAITCPNLQQLKISTCRKALRSLKGLQAIADNCHKLQSLSVAGISVTQLESQIEFWEILSTLKLTHLSADFCIISPYVAGVEYEGLIVPLYQKCSSLLILESTCVVYGCRNCFSSVNKDWLILNHFPSLKYCNLTDCFSQSTTVHNMITTLKLTHLRIHNSVFSSPLTLSSAPNYHLEQLYIVSRNSDLPDLFMSSVSAHGRLMHVFLSVRAASVVGVSDLIENSPKLVTFHCLLERTFDVHGKLPDEEFTECECMIKQKFRHRKVFDVGGFRLEQRTEHNQHSLNSPFLRHTDLNSL